MYKLFVFVLFIAVGIAAGQTDHGTDHGTATGTATETPQMQFQTLCGTVTSDTDKLTLLASKVTGCQ